MRTLRLSESDHRFLTRLLARRNNNNNNNSPSPRRTRTSGRERRAEKTKYLNRDLRRVYLDTNRNRHFIYTGQEGRKIRTYTEIFAFKNDWNQIRRLRNAGRRTTRPETEYRRPARRGNYRR